MANIPIWPGSSSFSPGETPFGFYDDDADFQADVDRVADWCARRLGYPVMEVELQDLNFYTAFEEAITTYGQYVYQYEIIENIGTFEGNSSGSAFNNQYIQPNLGNVIAIAEQYGTEAGSGGSINIKTGSIDIKRGQQKYFISDIFTSVSESGSTIEIKRIYHNAPPAISRYFDPYAGTGTGIQSLMQTFGFGNMSPGVNFMLMPIFYDLLKLQAIEFNDQIRKSAYSFELYNNDFLRIFPIPQQDSRLWFDYIVKEERNNPVNNDNTGLITDISNVPYENPIYRVINQPGRNWIRRYTLALAKEMLANTRGKYTTVPIPGSEVTTNADALRAEAASELATLIEELKLMLEESMRHKYLERDSQVAELTQGTLGKTPPPAPIYIF
jgi:hypothetical protein